LAGPRGVHHGSGTGLKGETGEQLRMEQEQLRIDPACATGY